MDIWGIEMNDETIQVAVDEARRFLKRARAYQKRRTHDNMMLIVGSREAGDVRRSSMDLTRVLADMRQGR